LLKGYRHVTQRNTEYDLQSDPILDPILSACQEANTNSHKIYQTTLKFAVPKSPSHKFWSQNGLRKDDGKFEDSIEVEISGFGGSEGDAKGHALMKLISFVELVRKLIRLSSVMPEEGFQMTIREEVHSVMIVASVPFRTRIEDRNGALEMGSSLLRVYQRLKNFFPHDKYWEQVAGFISDCLEKYRYLEPLILYYLVHPRRPGFDLLIR
jgi:hypothetical protein